MKVKTTIELSAKQEAYVLNLCRGMRPTVAAVAAGWSTASARNMLRSPVIAMAIKHCAANLALTVARINALGVAAE